MDLSSNLEIYRKAYEEASVVLSHEVTCTNASHYQVIFWFQALGINSGTIDQINTFIKQLEEVRTNIEESVKCLNVNAIVPIGTKAMVKGKLGHTNEIYVNLGDRWFLKTSGQRAIEICDRMIESER